MIETTSTYGPARPPDTVASGDRPLAWDYLEHVSWGAIFLGLVIALGVQILLGLLGIAIGFSVLDPSDPGGAWGIGSAIFTIIVQILSLFLGGYIAARLSPAFTDRSAMLHGASIWALSTVIMVWLGTTAAGMMLTGMSNAVASIGNAAGRTVQAIVPDNFNPDNINLDLPQVAFENLPAEVKQTLRERGITPNNLEQEIAGAYREVVSPQQQQALLQALQEALADIARSPGDAATDTEQAVDDIFGQGGVLTQQDAQQFEQALQNRLGLSDNELQQITRQVEQAAAEARQAAGDALAAAQQQAVTLAKGVSDSVASIAFWTFIASLLGLIAAVVGGRIGRHNPFTNDQ